MFLVLYDPMTRPLGSKSQFSHSISRLWQVVCVFQQKRLYENLTHRNVQVDHHPKENHVRSTLEILANPLYIDESA